PRSGPADVRPARRPRLQVHLHHPRRPARRRPRPVDAARRDGRRRGAGLHRAAAARVRAGLGLPDPITPRVQRRALPPRAGQGVRRGPPRARICRGAPRGEGRLALLLVVGLARPLLELGFAHAGPGLLALALALELRAHEPALLLGLGWHAGPPFRATVGRPASRAPRQTPHPDFGSRTTPTMRG